MDRLKELKNYEIIRIFNSLNTLTSYEIPCDAETMEEFRKEMIERRVKPFEERLALSIKSHKRITHTTLLQQWSRVMNSADLSEAIQTLVALGDVEVVKEQGKGRAKTIYVWKEQVNEQAQT